MPNSALPLSTIVEQIIFTNNLRLELVEAMRYLSKYYRRIKKNNISFNKAKEIERFQKYYSLCFLLLEDWGDELDECDEQILTFSKWFPKIDLQNSPFVLYDDFNFQKDRFCDISTDCMFFLAGKIGTFEITIYDWDDLIDDKLQEPSQKVHVKDSLRSRTAILIRRAEVLQEQFIIAIQNLQDIEDEILKGEVCSYDNPSLFIEENLSNAETIFNDLKDVHEKLAAEYNYSLENGLLDGDRTVGQFLDEMENLFLINQLNISLEAVTQVSSFLLALSETSA